MSRFNRMAVPIVVQIAEVEIGIVGALQEHRTYVVVVLCNFIIMAEFSLMQAPLFPLRKVSSSHFF